MKRTELTAKAMKDMGWTPIDANDLRIKDIVFNIQQKNEDGTYFWKLRCVDGDKRTSRMSYGMCSTYEVYYKNEYLEVSVDGKDWHKVAERFNETNRVCRYAD